MFILYTSAKQTETQKLKERRTRRTRPQGEEGEEARRSKKNKTTEEKKEMKQEQEQEQEAKSTATSDWIYFYSGCTLVTHIIARVMVLPKPCRRQVCSIVTTLGASPKVFGTVVKLCNVEVVTNSTTSMEDSRRR